MSTDTTQSIRAWTLEGAMRLDCLVVIREPNAPPSSDHERTAVIEREPMLDLLAEWFESRPLRRADNVDGRSLDRRTVAFLREHGRLG